MAETFGDVWNKLRLYVPALTPLLAKDMVLSRYRKLCDERSWSFLRGEGAFTINPSKSGTATVTQGSQTLTAGTLVLAASDFNRQAKFGSGPPITLIAVDPVGQTATLDRPWPGLSQTLAVTVADLYAICPADFGRFIAVVDPTLQRRIRIFTTEEELNAADPARLNTGQPWALVSYRLSDAASTLGRVMYEWWPYYAASSQTSTLQYPFLYVKRPQIPADDDLFQGPVRDRADVLLDGALADAYRWPGSDADHRNPAFNLAAAGDAEQRWKEQVAMLEVRDEETYPIWWHTTKLDIYGMQPLAPQDSSYLQNHEG